MQEIIDSLIETAKKEIMEGKEYLATLLHIYEHTETKEKTFVLFPVGHLVDNETSKVMMLKTTHAFARTRLAVYKERLQAAYMLADAYYSFQELKPEHIGMDMKDIPVREQYVRAGNDPKRKEGLMVITCTKDKVRVNYHGYERMADKRIVFSDTHSADEHLPVTGYMAKLFPANL